MLFFYAFFYFLSFYTPIKSIEPLKVNELIQNYVFKVSLIEFIKDTMKLNFESSALFVIDKIIKLNGDGIVSMKSQYLSDISIKQNIIYGTHKSGYKKVMKIVLK